MLFPLDLISWKFVFVALIIVILIVPFAYDGGREAVTYHGKFFFYYFLVSLSAVGFSFLFVFNARNVKNCCVFIIISMVVILGLKSFLTKYRIVQVLDVFNSRYAADILRHLSGLMGIKWELRDMRNMIKGGAIVVANHQSSLDILGMFEMWRIMGKCTAISKKELFYFWPFGLCAWLAGVVFIDRSKASKAYDKLVETSKLTQREKTKIFFFPEGTRNHRVNKTKKLLPFKKGAFRMAILCQVPVIPVVFSPYYFVNSEERYFGQGEVIIRALPPIPTKGLTEKDTEDLMERTKDIMSKAFDQLFEEVVSKLPQDHFMQNYKTKE